MTPTAALHQVEQLARRTFTLGQPVDGAPAGCDLINPEPDHLPADGPDLLAGD